MVSFFRNIGKWVASTFAGSGIATAGGSGDATEVDGAYFDRQNILSVMLVITGEAVLAAAATLTLAANIQDDADGVSTGTDYGDAFAAAVVATGPGGGGTVSFRVEMVFDLAAARRYIRAQVTPNLSAANTDTCRWSAAWVYPRAQA